MSNGPDAVPARVDDAVLEDLHRRLTATRRVALPRGQGWERGVDADYLTDLLTTWRDDYDWRVHEERLRAYPWVVVEGAEDRPPLRLVHQRGGDRSAPPVVLLHGWPDSFLRFERVLPLLTERDVVVPCLPGYPYSEPWTQPETQPGSQPGMSSAGMAGVVDAAMTALGYDRYVLSGGDIGSSVAEQIAVRHPDRVAALHLTDMPYSHLSTIDPDDLSDAEQAYLAAGREWQMAEGAYALEQATKPHTLAVGLGDSPAGLLAWVLEKLRGWSDSGGDIESVFSRDEILTWVTLYWVTGTIGTSFTPYALSSAPIKDRIEVPTAVTIFPHDLVRAPREFAARVFDLRFWHEEPSGGHFGAWERPEAYADGVRQALALADG